jgi:hypothetical protein
MPPLPRITSPTNPPCNSCHGPPRPPLPTPPNALPTGPPLQHIPKPRLPFEPKLRPRLSWHHSRLVRSLPPARTSKESSRGEFRNQNGEHVRGSRIDAWCGNDAGGYECRGMWYHLCTWEEGARGERGLGARPDVKPG